MDRKLTTIMAADVFGYTRLMSDDEERTLAVMNQRWRELVLPRLSEHGGEVIKFLGDGLLSQFGSPVECVRAAVEIQEAMTAANAGLAPADRIVLRIGINLGDVIQEGDDLFGGGVNLAVRLQTLAQPGAICLADNVYHLVRKRVAVPYASLGEQQIKNLEEPVRVWQVGGAPASPAVLSTRPRPVIAVLPFTNMSGDPALVHFADGIAEDIITELGRFRTLAVAGRNASFLYRDPAISRQQIGRELNAQYLLEGSVRTSGDRVRITAQLVDAESGGHLWAERYDRTVDDPFAVQDDVTRSIVSTLSTRIEDAILEKSSHRALPLWGAYECCLAGDRLMLASRAVGVCQEAQALFEKAIELDPHYAPPYTNLSRVTFRMARLHSKGDPERHAALIAQSFSNAKRAVALDPSDVTALNVLGFRHLVRREFALAERLFERAAAFNPHEGRSAMVRVTGLVCLGRPSEAVELARATIARNPGHPDFYIFDLGEALFYAGEVKEAAAAFQRLSDHQLEEQPAVVVAALALSGDIAQARARAADYLDRLRAAWIGPPDAGADALLRWELEHEFWLRRREDLDHVTAGLRAADLPV